MFKKILLPVDLQETALSERAAGFAQDLAERYQSGITALTVIPDFGLPLVAGYFPEDALRRANDEVCTELRRFIAARFGESNAVRCEVRQGSPHRVIVQYAHDHGTDLIIMPARAMDISKAFLGSSSTHVVQRAPCSVLVVRP